MIAILLTLALTAIQPAHAAPLPRLVLMPLHVPAADAELSGTMSSIISKNLSRRHKVIEGAHVERRTRKVFATGCDEEECLTLIADSFHSDLIAVVNIIKRYPDGHYYMTLLVRDVSDGRTVWSNALTCRRCGVAEVLERLNELSGGPEPVAQTQALGSLVWIPATAAMTWRDARAYCARHEARLPTLDDFFELYNTGTLAEQSRVGSPIWSAGASGRGTHYVVAPVQGTKMPWADDGLNYVSCVR